MKNKYLTLSNTILKSIFLTFLLITSFAVFQVKTYANDAITPYYEKITKQYPSMEQYIADSRKKIKDNWYPSALSFEKSATILLKLSKNGDLLDRSISVSSNDDKFDNSLLEAVDKTKFSPLPNDVNEENVYIDMAFKMQRRNIINKKTVNFE